MVGVNTATSKPRFQGKQKRKKKNGKSKQKLSDVVDELFEVQREVPDLEREFYIDQQTTRKLFVGGVDEEATEKMIEESEQKEQAEKDKAKRDAAKKKRESKEQEQKKGGLRKLCGMK